MSVWRDWIDALRGRLHAQTAMMAETWAAEMGRSGLNDDTPANRKRMNSYMARLRLRFPHSIRPVHFAGWHGTEFCFTDGSRAAIYPALPGRVYFSSKGEGPELARPELPPIASGGDRTTMMLRTGAMLARMNEEQRKVVFAETRPAFRAHLDACLALYLSRSQQ